MKSLKFMDMAYQAFATGPTEWRWGQTIFNLLFDEYPKLADEIRASSLDPYYFDERVPRFWGWLQWKLDHSGHDVRATQVAFNPPRYTIDCICGVPLFYAEYSSEQVKEFNLEVA